MKIQTMSIVVGNKACNAHCPYCISRMTGNENITTEVNWRNFRIACGLAEVSGATTVLLTGKGEPTLHPKLIADYVFTISNRHNLPLIELQTNGIKLNDPTYVCDDVLYGQKHEPWANVWYRAGLTTICLSTVHYDRKRNQEIYGEDYPDIKELVDKLHNIGYTVRLSVMLAKGFIDSLDSFFELIRFCKANHIKQLTVRPIDHPENPSHNSASVYEWVEEHTLREEWERIKGYVEEHGDKILDLVHGAKVYDLNGQNVCLSTCLTTNDNIDNMRQIIFFPDGTISWDWKYRGAMLL